MHDKISSPGMSRRTLIKLMGATGATLTLASLGAVSAEGETPVFSPNAFLEISEKDGVTLWLKKAEMGQHILTATAMMMADELGADLDAMTIRQADTHPKFGFVGTGGSFAIPGRWIYMRPLFASARAMLLRAAAETWEVPVAEVSVDKGVISHTHSGRSGKLEAFAAKASGYDVPEDMPLRDRKNFRYMGTKRARLDTDAVLSGTARYGVDVRMDGLRFAVMARPRTRDGMLTSHNKDAALAVPGVQEVHVIGDKVAVIATNSWAAIRGRGALDAQYDAGPFAAVSTTTIRRDLEAAFAGESADVRTEGALPRRPPLVEATYEMPLAQHAALEPVNATAVVKGGKCLIWGPVQMATFTAREAAEAIGLREEDVTVYTTLLGGSFGRKLERDYAVEAAQIAALTKGPVQLLLTREDDMVMGGVRPPSRHHIRMWDAGGAPAFEHIYSTLSVNAQQDPAQLEHRGYDWTAALGSIDIPYRFSALSVRQHDVTNHAVQLNWWRGTHHNHHAFASECAMDEYALARGIDPFDLRLSLLTADTTVETYPNDMGTVSAKRLKAVLGRLRNEVMQAVAPEKGHGIGIACHVYTDVFTYVGHAVEASVENGLVKVHRVWAVVDCGLAVSPDSVRAQVEGSVVFGVTSALWGETRVEDGQIIDVNFDTYRLMRMDEAPEIHVTIMENDEAPGGMGEPPLPSVTPALLNALARAKGGKRIRKLPIGDQLSEV
jgi:isoquinoline 1-oxidoreductase beta subunit|nr:molybdopterin cofactor-binding domain-containing protein [Kordiimonas sp. UBA4487]